MHKKDCSPLFIFQVMPLKVLVRPITQFRLGYLHETLLECISAYQIKIMCHIQLLLLSVSELWPFGCVLCLFCIIYILVHVISHSEFSQDDVSGTRMSDPPF